MRSYIALDVGGSHITSGRVRLNSGSATIEKIHHQNIDSQASADQLLNDLVLSIQKVVNDTSGEKTNAISFSFPGPFDYNKGICKILGVNKFESIFGVDLKNTLVSRLATFDIEAEQITFLNDCQSFLLGNISQDNGKPERVLALTVGTGLGSASYADGKLYSGLLDDTPLYDSLFKDGIAEDYFSTRWFLKQAKQLGIDEDYELVGVKDLAEIYEDHPAVQSIFHSFGRHLAEYLNHLMTQKEVDRIIFGGNIFKSFHLFEESFYIHFSKNTIIQIAEHTSEHSILGTATNHDNQSRNQVNEKKVRNSISEVLPAQKTNQPDGYDIYPTFHIGDQKIKEGYGTLAEYISEMESKSFVIDGNIGTIWQDVVNKLNLQFEKKGKRIVWQTIDACMKEEDEILKMIEPYLGGDDPIFGIRYPGRLEDFFDKNALNLLNPAEESTTILYGTGAALANWDAPLIYIDQPKNEIQYRSRAGSVTNLGAKDPDDPKKMYKQFYFVDWPVCNQHKKELLDKIDLFVDGQRVDTVTWATGQSFREGLAEMVTSPFRVRPWFEPGVWGGQWMKDRFEHLNPEAPNYAWSFEIIAPENGVLLESDGWILEADLEFLMATDNKAVLGKHQETYGDYIPIRFDYLDTMDGENLSLQCHPRLDYIQKHFGEPITQDETYYIMDAGSDTDVYLGFQEEIDSAQFQEVFKNCEKSGEKVDVETYVQTFPSKKHDLFLIPAGTIHCSGKNNMVLEISNTPYIFTFKIYDWQRLDLDGNPRPINLERAMENLNFERKGKRVEKELISKPQLAEEGSDWKIIQLPTHEEHIYSIDRLEFKTSIQVKTENRFHIINLVEGESVAIIHEGKNVKLHYAETIVIPAATGEYRIENASDIPVKIIKAYLK